VSGRDDELRRQDGSAWPNLFRRARFFSAVDFVQADRLRYQVMEAMDAMFREVDAVVGPSWGDMLVAKNFTGHPCLHLRAGFRELPTRRVPWLAGLGVDQGAEDAAFAVPFGVSLWSGLFEEGRLLTLGLALEAALGVAERRPE
jgi:Asp-tRNA(Asn)/Glu-tRNA(Gln) amidotransferase A subunit family amidase